MDIHAEYLALLGDLTRQLDRLTALAQEKTVAVRRSDLLALDEVLKQEQAISLALRGLEQRRLTQLTRLGLADVPLNQLAQRFPAALQPQASQTVNTLRRSYESYRTAAELARTTLEVNLHQVELVIAAQGGAPAHGAGYVPPDAEPPQNMKTDFRA